MRSFLLSFALLVAACGGEPKPVDTTPKPNPALSDDGLHFRADRVYEGQCAPEGSRGGCHTITLHADGTMDNFLFDANVTGTYEIHDHIVALTADGSGFEDLTLSDDLTKLGDLDLKP